MFDFIKSFFVNAGIESPQPPKVKPGNRTYASYLTSATPSDNVLPRVDRRLANTDTTTFRNATSTREVIRQFAYANPDMSSAIWSYIRLGIPNKFTCVAYSAVDGKVDREASLTALRLIDGFELLPDYSVNGFTSGRDLRSVSSALARELMLYGACSGELVLNKARLPDYVTPVSVTQIEFIADVKANSLKPVQKLGSETVDLDIPTYFYVELDDDLLDPYASSPVESAVKPAIFSESFTNDITRVVQKAIHPRQKVKIDEEKFRLNLSDEAKADDEVARKELNALILDITNQISSLTPDQALVYLDSLEFQVENPSNAGLANEYTTLQNMINARMSAGSKTNGTILGFAAGSSNIASAEIMLFQKYVTSAVKVPLEMFWSKVVTLALRLYGFDVIAKFEFAEIDLRPESDLAAFRQTQQMMVLEQLSLGLITDEEASLKLTGRLPPDGYVPLSGTRFKDSPGQSANVQNSTNSGSALNQNLNGETPNTARGQNRRAQIVPLMGE
jgi:hypothetical protein